MSFSVCFVDSDGNQIEEGSYYSPVVPRHFERVQIGGQELFVTDVVYRPLGGKIRTAFVTLAPPATEEPFDDPTQSKED